MGDVLSANGKVVDLIGRFNSEAKRPVRSKRGKKGLFSRIVSLRDKKTFLGLFGLRAVNNVLMGGCVFLTLFLVFDFHRQGATLRKRLANIVSGEDSVSAQTKKYPALGVNLKESVAMARERNIFSFSPLGDGGDIKSQRDASDIAVNLKLVGIFWSADNPQALIEDTEGQNTLLVNIGDYLSETIVVKQIYRDKVVIETAGQRWELK